MSKYIDADALKEAIIKMMPHYKCGEEMPEEMGATDMAVSVIQEIDEMSAADVEPMRKWISVENEKPEDGQVVNVITKSKNGLDGLDIVVYRQADKEGAFYEPAENNYLEIYGMHVTHWAAIPGFPLKMDGGSEGDHGRA